MIAMAVAVLTVFIILVACELWWQRHETDDEFSRKSVHITIGSFVAFWPFFLTWGQIEILSLAFLVIVSISKYLHIFEAIHSVQRPTWGELFFAAAVGVTALLTHDKWIYAAALLQMSLADGMAAIIGTRFGGRYKYLVLGHPKSVAGSLAFFSVSLAILLVFNGHFDPSHGLALMIGTSILASFVENIGISGSDNLLVPVLVAAILVHA